VVGVTLFTCLKDLHVFLVLMVAKPNP